ncbi:MAG: hypothetical protein F4Y91_18445 [Gemmatimonadetes bacterium]|nr:hypothetical protein [Gemmatimonadota bacterium]MXY83981.1 hypothetical protein [Gemmatimonadota bacterium]MYB70890.1 hypothetical protein [Gemmatimonadota bacterium]
MLTRKADVSIGSPSALALLVLTVLFAAVIGGLPFSHQLFHESLVEPENCPAYLLQSGLSLLFWGLVLALVALASESNPSAPRTVPLPLFTPRFTHLNRGPPRC